MVTTPRSRWVRVLLCVVVWLLPLGILWLGATLIPQDPSAPANMFGPVGPRQTAMVWTVVVTPVVWIVLSKVLRLGLLWIVVAVAVLAACAYLLSALDLQEPEWLVGALVLLLPPVVAAVVTPGPRSEVRPS